MKMQRCSKHGCEYLVSCTYCACEDIINGFNAPFTSKLIHFETPGEYCDYMDKMVDKVNAELDRDYKIQNDTPNGDFAREYAEQKEKDRADVESLIRSIK